NDLPSGRVNVTTSGDFSPGAMPGPLGIVACMDVTGTFSRCTFIPSLSSTAAHPLSASREVTARPAAPRGNWASCGEEKNQGVRMWKLRLFLIAAVGGNCVRPTIVKASQSTTSIVVGWVGVASKVL